MDDRSYSSVVGMLQISLASISAVIACRLQIVPGSQAIPTCVRARPDSQASLGIVSYLFFPHKVDHGLRRSQIGVVLFAFAKPFGVG